MNKKKLSALVSLLEDDEIRPEIEEKIFSIGENVIPFLEEKWSKKNSSPSVQRRMKEIIHSLQFQLLKKQLVDWKNNEPQNLLKGMWLIATYQYPNLTLESITKKFKQLHHKIWSVFEAKSHPYEQIKTINNIFFNELRFKANTRNFYSPNNLMINLVFESKRGSSITLSIIYILIAQKLNMPVDGVSLPNFFFIIYKKTDKNLPFYINVFNRGLIFTKQDIDHYLGQINVNLHPKFYEACTHTDIIVNVLRNLIISFEKLNEHSNADEVKQLLVLFKP